MDFLTLFLILFTIFFVISLLGAIQRRRRMNQMRARYINRQYRGDSDADIIIVQPSQPSYGYNQFQGGYYQQPGNSNPNYGGQYNQPGYAQPVYAQPYYHPPPPSNNS